MSLRLQLVAVVAAGLLFLFVFELVRRRRLMERYALLWLFSAMCLLALSAWRNALEVLSDAVGIVYAPSALFAVAFGFSIVLLLHFSLVVSRLVDQNKVLAQKQERLDQLTLRLDGRPSERDSHAEEAPEPQLTRRG
jgi:hypothetical protein